MAKERTVRERKESIKSLWERCFGMKMEDKLTEEGIKYFWDDSTTVSEAGDLLTGAVIHDLIDTIADDVFGKVSGVVIIRGEDNEEHDEEPCNIKNGAPYKIARVEDGKVTFIEDDEFETEEAAKAEIQERVNHSTHTLSDFCVIQVQVCK